MDTLQESVKSCTSPSQCELDNSHKYGCFTAFLSSSLLCCCSLFFGYLPPCFPNVCFLVITTLPLSLPPSLSITFSHKIKESVGFKRLASGKNRRYVGDGFNLDLTCILTPFKGLYAFLSIKMK